MNAEKTGALIATLRRERGLTQARLAALLDVSDRTVSKWERGAGLPDVSLLGDVAALFGVSIEALLGGELAENENAGGNMKQAKYFVCPNCGAMSVVAGDMEVSCCAKRLTAQQPQKAADDEKLTVEQVEDEWFVSSSHPMTKDHYISFVALATGQKITLMKQYPEWNLELRLPKREHGMLLWYCTQHGLFYQYL